MTITGYKKKCHAFDSLDKNDPHYLDDASGYISCHSFLAVKLDPPVKCDRCDRQACWTAGKNDEHHLCLRCRDNWWDFMHQPENYEFFSLRTWGKYYREFLDTEPWNEKRYDWRKG
ncbi:hypothetical protein ES707_03634 [subsurface metagenome]